MKETRHELHHNVVGNNAPADDAEVASSEDTNKDKGSTPSIGKILSLAHGEMCVLLCGFCLQVISELAELSIPMILARAYDAVVEDLDDGSSASEVKQEIAEIMTLVLILHAVSMALDFSRGLLIGLAGERIVARLRNRLYCHLLTLEIGFFDNHKSGELVSRLGSDTTLVQMGTSEALTEATIGFIKAVVCVGLMFAISWQLTVIVFAACLGLLVFSIPVSQWMGKLTTAYQDALSRAATVSTEALGAVRTLRSFGSEEVEKQRYIQHIGAPTGSLWPAKGETTLFLGARKVFVFSAFYSIGFFVGLGALYASLWYGFILYTEGGISVGELSAFQTYIFQIGFGLATLGHSITEMFEALGGARRIFELLEREPAEGEGGGSTQPGAVAGEVAFQDVHFAYPARPEKNVLCGFTLHVPAQSMAAIVGASGSGKSSALALLAHFYQPQSGRVTIDGVDLRAVDLTWLRRHVALVQQEPVLFGVSIWDNVCYGRHASPPREAEVEAACRKANAHDFISAFPEGYRTLVGERGVKLSGGQKQRLAIARALILDPRILLLDEATSALDAESEAQVQEAIDRTAAGRTVLVVAHRLSTVRDAHQIAVASHGAVVDVGSHRDLLARCEIYQSLVKRQTDGGAQACPGRLDVQEEGERVTLQA